jgi:hypothetical protein
MRCQQELIRLRMLLLSQDGAALSRRAMDVRAATNALMTEVEAMSQAVLAASRHNQEEDTFLQVRVTRLAMAADDAVNAARTGNPAALSAHLRHFEALMSAIWTVQQAVYGQPSAATPLSALPSAPRASAQAAACLVRAVPRF